MHEWLHRQNIKNNVDNQHFYFVIKADTVIYDAAKVGTPEIATDSRLPAVSVLLAVRYISSIRTSFISISEKD